MGGDRRAGTREKRGWRREMRGREPGEIEKISGGNRNEKGRKAGVKVTESGRRRYRRREF